MIFLAVDVPVAQPPVDASSLLVSATEELLRNECLKLNPTLHSDMKIIANFLLQNTHDSNVSEFANSLGNHVHHLVSHAQSAKQPNKFENMFSSFHRLCLDETVENQFHSTIMPLNLKSRATDFFLQGLLDTTLTILMTRQNTTIYPTTTFEKIPQEEEIALRYVAGYIPFKLKKMKNANKK